MLTDIPFQFFAWAASLLFAVEGIIVKIISKHQVSNPWLLSFFWTLWVFVINTGACLYFGAGLPAAWGNIILAGLVMAIGTVLFIFATYRLDVSIFAPLFNFRAAFVVILGWLFLGEIITPFQLFLIALMVVGGVVITLDEKFSIKSFFSLGVLFALADMVALAFMAMFLKQALAENSFWTVNLWYYLIGTALLLFTLPWFYKDVKSITCRQMGVVFLASLTGAIGNFAASKAYAANIGISGAIISIPLSVIMVMAISPFYPRMLEHHTAKVYAIRILAAIILVYAGLSLI